MASRTRTLYIDSVNRKAYSSLTSRITQSIVDFFVGDEEILQLINCKPNPDATSSLLFLNQPITGLLYTALGLAGQVATGGAFLMTDPVSTQVVSGIPFNVTPSSFQALLRAGWSTNYGACVVTQNGPCDYYVDRKTIGPIATAPTGDGTDLFPACFVNIIPVRIGVAASGPNPGTSDVFRIVLNQQPAAFLSTGWIALPSAAVTVTPLVTGSASPVVNAVFRVSINPDSYQGSFYVTAVNLGAGNVTTATSSAINFNSSDIDMQAQIIAGWGAGNEVTVNQVNAYTWDVTFTGNNIKAKNLSAFTGDASGLSVPVGLQGTLDLRTEAANAMLAGKPNQNVYFQVKNTDSNGIPQTWLYQNCTLNPTLISPQVLGSSNVPNPLTEAEGDLRYVQVGGDFSGLTGGSGKFDSLATVGRTAGANAIPNVSGVAYLYELKLGTASLGSPLQITPTDYATSGFYWQLLFAYVPVMGASGTSHAAGLVPDPGSSAGTTRFLREDGTWDAVIVYFPYQKKTANFTAVAGVTYGGDTTAGSITCTPPATPADGDWFKVLDVAKKWGTNALVVGSSSQNYIDKANPTATAGPYDLNVVPFSGQGIITFVWDAALTVWSVN